MSDPDAELPSVFLRLRGGLGWRDRPWLIAGKGPSFTQIAAVPADDWRILTLNDAVRAVPRADLAHFIDLDALERCSGALERARCVVMPWFPHSGNRPGPLHLGVLSKQHPLLARLRAQGRLLWYDLSSSPQRHGPGPVVTATFFSAEAALDLLAAAGVRTVRTVGVDGGCEYGEAFADLRGVSRLSNGQRRFDRQFESFARVIRRTGVDVAPWGMEAPMRVFIAASPRELLPAHVLAHSIRCHASASTVITPLCDLDIPIPQPRDERNQARTPFSFQRFLIPQACGHQGRALYLDSDMLVFRDILPLWRQPFGQAQALTVRAEASARRPAQTSVMLMDCSRLDWTVRDVVDALDEGRFGYEDLLRDFALASVRACIEPEWNSLERYVPGRTALLHYTDMTMQPWVSWANPLGRLWVKALRQAIAEGAITRGFVDACVARGDVRPSLLRQLDSGLDDGLLLPASARAADAAFEPPYRALPGQGGGAWTMPLRRLRAVARAGYEGTWVHDVEHRMRRRLGRGGAGPAGPGAPGA